MTIKIQIAKLWETNCKNAYLYRKFHQARLFTEKVNRVQKLKLYETPQARHGFSAELMLSDFEINSFNSLHLIMGGYP